MLKNCCNKNMYIKQILKITLLFYKFLFFLDFNCKLLQLNMNSSMFTNQQFLSYLNYKKPTTLLVYSVSHLILFYSDVKIALVDN